MPTFSPKFLIWLFGIFFTCETSKYNPENDFECPLSITPISFEIFSNVEENKPKDNYWTRCLEPDYSCAKIEVPNRGYFFGCIPDFGDIKPAFFQRIQSTKYPKVNLDNYFSLSKGCANMGDNLTMSTTTTLTWSNLTIVTQLFCCKGTKCSKNNTEWVTIWDDNEYAPGDFHPRNNLFWYTSASITGTLFSLIVSKLSLTGYQRLKERLVLESVKSLSRTVREADDEDQIKRKKPLSEMFRLRRRRKKQSRPDNSCTDVSHRTNSVQALIRSNKK